MSGAAGEVLSLEVAISRPEVLHFLGYPPWRDPPPRIEAILEEVIAEARRLARARGAFARFPAAEAPRVGLERAAGASHLAVGLVTAGPAIQGRVRELLRSGDHTRALLLDAAGSAAAEEAADALSRIIVSESGDTEAAPGACPHPPRESPGYGGFPLGAQPALFALLPHRALGVTLTASMLMIPEKSISFAMWLGPGVRPVPDAAGCERCALERCRYRRRGAGEELHSPICRPEGKDEERPS